MVCSFKAYYRGINIVIIAIAGFNSEYGFFFLICAVIVLMWLIYRILDRNNNLWVVTNLRVIDELGVFSNNSKETPLDKINNISYSQSLLGKMFNYGNVKIRSAAVGGVTAYKMVEKPKLLKDTIFQYQELYKQEQIKKQAQSFADAVGGQKQSGKIDIQKN